MMALFEKHRQDKAAQVDVLSLDNKHGRITPPTMSSEAVSRTVAKPVGQTEQAPLTLSAGAESRAEEIVEAAERPSVTSLSVSPANCIRQQSDATRCPLTPGTG